jgi:hypothetical protein
LSPALAPISRRCSGSPVWAATMAMAPRRMPDRATSLVCGGLSRKSCSRPSCRIMDARAASHQVPGSAVRGGYTAVSPGSAPLRASAWSAPAARKARASGTGCPAQRRMRPPKRVSGVRRSDKISQTIAVNGEPSLRHHAACSRKAPWTSPSIISAPIAASPRRLPSAPAGGDRYACGGSCRPDPR